MMPVITLVFGLTLPSGLMLYWFVSTMLMGLQQWLQLRTPILTKEKNSEKN
jgi:membrane protein insertase Oxa1/YidC/SpoIIIJ